jgi:phasin family protein
MTTQLDQPALAAWKKQLDTAWRVLEVVTEGSRRVREMQLEVAVETHAKTEASRKLLAGANDVQQIWRVQADWLAGNAADCTAYWRRLYEAAAETQAALVGCLSGQVSAPGLAAGAQLPEAGNALIQMMDQAYKQWLDTTQQFYTAPSLARPEVREPA